MTPREECSSCPKASTFRHSISRYPLLPPLFLLSSRESTVKGDKNKSLGITSFPKKKKKKSCLWSPWSQRTPQLRNGSSAGAQKEGTKWPTAKSKEGDKPPSKIIKRHWLMKSKTSDMHETRQHFFFFFSRRMIWFLTRTIPESENSCMLNEITKTETYFPFSKSSVCELQLQIVGRPNAHPHYTRVSRCLMYWVIQESLPLLYWIQWRNYKAQQ